MKADSCNQPQKIKFLMTSVLHSCYEMASAGSQPYFFVKTWKIMGCVDRLILTIGQNSFFFFHLQH
jgi:hypothetical protein